MGVATHPLTSSARPRHVLLVGSFVVGWSVGRGGPRPDEFVRHPPEPVALELPATPAAAQAPRLRRPARFALAGALAAVVLAGAALVVRPDSAAAPLVDPTVAARAHARAETARVTLLRHLQLAGIVGRGTGLPQPPEAQALSAQVSVQPFRVQPSDRQVALATYVQALGLPTILDGLEASRDALQQKVLNDPRVSIYPAGRSDVTSGKLDVRILAMIEYLAQADGSVGVSCLISGHSLYVAGRPGVVSAHIYGRAVDINSVAGIPILGHQGPGTIAEKAIEQILALPDSIEPKQVISLMTLGGPSFALADHYNHIHIGY
ncbi:MAG TPA: hypothetical protein VHS03_00435 [Gaiellaceae bacterium]|jgi:hypothetical protein|nr:hypothetical protein [Gaiellaceae bacterium]